LQLAAPEEPWPGYVTITVFHFAESQRTPERYLFDQSRTPAGDPADIRTGVQEIVVAGRPAQWFEAAVDRYPPLGMSGDKVPGLVRHVIVPASRGFFVLRYDAPESASTTYLGTFDRVVGSFAPADMGEPVARDTIPAGEYEVYTALFGVKAPGGLDSPQFFESVPNSRLVAGRTMSAEKPANPEWPGDVFGPLDPGLIKDYQAKNETEWPLADRIMVPHLTVISPEELDARLKAALRGPAGEEENVMGLRGGFVTLSRVGFNGAGDLALLSAAMTSPGAMRAQYLVLMEKRESGWGLGKVVMEGLIYH